MSTARTSSTERALREVEQAGLLRARELNALGISPTRLNALADEGRIVRLARGLYSSLDYPLTESLDLILAARLVPRAVICLISALSFHNLGTQEPRQVWIAVPKGTKAPRLSRPTLRVVTFDGTAYSDGIEIHELGGTTVRIYSKEKTIADVFRFRRRVGLDVALEALVAYVRSDDRNLPLLEKTAKRRGVLTALSPYLQALVA